MFDSDFAISGDASASTAPQNPGFFFGGMPDATGFEADFFSSTVLGDGATASVPTGSPHIVDGLRSFFLPKPEKMLSESLLIIGSDSFIGAIDSVGTAFDSVPLPTPNILATVSQDDRSRDGDSTFGEAA